MNYDPTVEIRWMWRIAVGCMGGVLWLLGTVWIGAVTICRGIRAAFRLRWMFRQTLPCPRGHQTPTYGVYECACGSLHEGYVFARCRVCGMSAGWTPCLICGLPVRNPRF